MTLIEILWITAWGLSFGYRTDWSAQVDWMFGRKLLRLALLVCVVPAIYEYATITAPIDFRYVLPWFALAHAAFTGVAALFGAIARWIYDTIRAHTFLFGPRA